MKDSTVKRSKDDLGNEENFNEIKRKMLEMLVKILNRQENTRISTSQPVSPLSAWSAKRNFHKTKDDRKRPGWELAYGKRAANWDRLNQANF